MSISTVSYFTGGLYPNLPNYSPLVVRGSPVVINPTIILNPSEDRSLQGLSPNLNLTPQQLFDLQSIATLRNPAGSIIVPTPTGFLEMGGGHVLDFDPTTLQGRITPALANNVLNQQEGALGGAMETYTGADVRLLIEAAETPSNGHRYAKQLLEATTISVGTHREVAPVRAGGYINPKGFALGKRTIAGTLIVTQFTVEVLFRFLQSVMLNDGSKDTVFTKIDQLPPFNITMILTNEAGYASERKIIGVKFVTDGVVYSIQDMLIEQTISWMATDFTPLVPLTLSSLYQPTDLLNKTTRRERTPSDVMNQSTFL